MDEQQKEIPFGDRIIMHVDMNAFFASVEQQNDPRLRGKPVAVVGSSKRTIVTTCSYEARAFGVKTGMALWEAKSCCPNLILVVGKNREYTRISSLIMKLMYDFTPLVETFSIDEAFLDISGSLSLFGTPENIASLLKARIGDQFGLTCSIGIAPNKLLAKLASDMQKPDGLTVIKPAEVALTMDRTPIRDMCGIGKKTEKSLTMLGIRTCGDLGRFPVKLLRQKFGIVGEALHLMGLGVDDSPVVPQEESDLVKSVGHSMTLEKDLEKREDILRYLLQLAEMVGRRMRRYGVAGKTVCLSVRYADFFTNFSRQLTLPEYTNLSAEIYRGAVTLLDSVELTQPVRLLGVKLSNLRHQDEQLPLFEGERKKAHLAKAMDEVNSRFGEFSVTYGTLLTVEGKKGSFVISPAWRPQGIRKVDVE
ncbi:DNA polymerase IV [Geotalea daltonii FRC-32]|uniref:DNA polymerase IV n=1 Tax=Geotalea daltonii (strain DSM 22248 / JCM 15807 / FRC-32) TaxID=316067 RepID=B9M459_GEODF|nr:DNA polymerase IV [Geotalea daltonii]ACM21514.1 DNA polymerase IV [Geotalea daltonii FRC-32]